MSSAQQHSTTVNAPLYKVWHELISADGWSWCDCIRLEMKSNSSNARNITLQEGSQGVMRVRLDNGDGDTSCSKTNKSLSPKPTSNKRQRHRNRIQRQSPQQQQQQQRRWEATPCTFQMVDHNNHTLEWTSQRRQNQPALLRAAADRIVHTIKLHAIDANTTSVQHTVTRMDTAVKRLAKAVASPSKKNRLQQQQQQQQMTTILRLHQSLKHHVESMHFQHLVLTFSSRQLSLDTKLQRPMSVSRDDDDTDDTAPLSCYWESPAHLRNQIAACYLMESERRSMATPREDDSESEEGQSLGGIGDLPF
eukprot:CAMPEP_0198112694 /NCGR_PEP_ID=MMETSP1442-20131203/4500_1 /TAXON_ID= /ORGANISM="Craspedostauros australis, Strain CCMP3328" /LENGTH=306 /DNA_ID=CAMNT_0043769559 /DNA_START=285 /DNA_END=1205 /DNA_ORIENTATION=+